MSADDCRLMLPDISEFSFGFALVSELIAYEGFDIAGAPRFPTQNQEGVTGGYDVELPRMGVAVFLQIKRCDCLVQMNAAEAAQLGLPYYRMHLRPRKHSRQHELLLDWEVDHPEVYYAAPRFHKTNELDEAYQTNTVAERSMLIKPSEIGPLPDQDEHYVSVNAAGDQWLLCSDEPRRLHARSTQQVLQDINETVRSRPTTIDSDYLTRLGNRIVETYIEKEIRPESRAPADVLPPKARERAEEAARREVAVRRKTSEVRQRRTSAGYAREVAQTLLGCELLVVAEPGRADRR